MFDIVSVELKVRYSKNTCILYLGSWISGVGARNPASMQLPDCLTAVINYYRDRDRDRCYQLLPL